MKISTEVPYVGICLNGYWQRALNENKPVEGIHPWFLNMHEGHNGLTTRLVHNLRISGTCFGDTMNVPGKRPIKVVACGKSSFIWDGDNLHIQNSTPIEKSKCERRVLVRLFTPWLEERDDDKVLPWRILNEEDPGRFVERPARHFEIVGESFGLRYDFPKPVGSKMHIACYGNLDWDGERARITA